MTGEELPKARVRRRRPWLQVMWVVPLVAAAVAVWLVYDRVRQYGPEITVEFKDGSGLRAGQTLGAACQAARLQIREANPGNSTWLAYVLYAHPLGVLQTAATAARTN